MKATFEIDPPTIQRLLALHIGEKLTGGQRVFASDVKLRLQPLRLRKKHPRRNPLRCATVTVTL